MSNRCPLRCVASRAADNCGPSMNEWLKPQSCSIEISWIRESAVPPACRTTSSKDRPRQWAPTLQPSTQLIGNRASCTALGSRSASVNRYGLGPTTSKAHVGDAAAAMTCACSAVRLTGTPCGPLVHCRGASSPSGSSGVTVWPTEVKMITPTPAPAAVSMPRREIPGVGGSASVPAMLWDSGFSFHGISVRTSASGTLALRPYAISGSFIPTWSSTEPTSTYARKRWTVRKYHGNGYQLSTLRKPVVTCTSAAETKIATLSRSTACLIDLIGGKRNWFG